jgi:hypothetical protein
MATNGQYNIKNTHYDQYLTNISVSYGDNGQYIGEQVIPVVNVDKQSDKYMVFDYQDDKIADDDIRRAPGTVATEIRTGWSDDAYFTEGFAKRSALYDEELANTDEDRIFNLKETAAKLVKGQLLLHKELNSAALMTNPLNFHADLRTTFGGAGNPAKWSDFDNSNPIMDLFKLREKAERLGSNDFNALVLSKPVYNILKMHPRLKALTSNGLVQPDFVSDEMIKQLLGVDKLIIANARKATSAQRRVGEGGLTNYIWGNNAVLMYLPNNAGRDTPAAAYTFQWTNPKANVVGAQKTREYYSEESKTLWIESEEWYAQKIVSTLGAVVLSDVVDPLVV